MSVWATIWDADGDWHEATCTKWVQIDKGIVELDGDRDCTCGQPGAPIAYQGSHILPAPTDTRTGIVSLAAVPAHITRDGRDDGPDEGQPWPYLRLSVGEADVVLDEALVADMRRALGEWLKARGTNGEDEHR